jgi:2'-5' RNA ligase
MDARKYFIAIVLPPEILEPAEALKQELFLTHGLKGALRSPAHITLHRPFSLNESREKMLIEKLEQFRNGPPFEIQLKNFAAFIPRVIYIDVLPNGSLVQLHDNLMRFAKRELQLFNEADDMRGFHPHVTIASRDLKKDLFKNIWPEFVSRKFEAGFMCDSVTLLKLEKKWVPLKDFKF